MAQTLVVISSSGAEYPLPGLDWTLENIKTSLASVVPGIASMTTAVVDLPNGDKRITFSQQTGQKGILNY